MFFIILYYRKQINYDLSDCLHASVTELRHICISKRRGSKLPLMKAVKVNINKRILSTLWDFCIVLFVLLTVRLKKMWNTSLVPIQWVKPHDATKMPQLLCVKLEDPKKFTSQALRRSRAVIHLGITRNVILICFFLLVIQPTLQVILRWEQQARHLADLHRTGLQAIVATMDIQVMTQVHCHLVHFVLCQAHDLDNSRQVFS